jgi:hypothetical protein
MSRPLCLALALLLAAPAAAQTDVSGTISSNTTWGPAGSPYVVTNNVTVASGATLTVQGGVEVRFNGGRSLVVEGALAATGATFTANAEAPGRSAWQRIRVEDGATATLTNTTVEFADRAVELVEGGTAALDGVTIASVRLAVEAQPAEFVGARVYDVWDEGGLSLNDVVVSGSYAVGYLNTPVPYTVTGSNSFLGNDFEALFAYFYAHRGTWTIPAGPTVVWWLVNAAVSDRLVVEPGAVVKNRGNRRRVRELDAVGTAGQPVVFTAYRDDTVGGDSDNTDGSTAGPGQGGEIEVTERAAVRFAEFRFGNAGRLRVDGGFGHATASVADSEFTDNAVGLYLASAGVTVEGNTFAGNTQYPLEVGASVRGGLSPDENTGLLPYLPIRFTLEGTGDEARRDTLYDLGLTYLLPRAVNVRDRATLVLDAGVVVKGETNGGVNVASGGALVVAGTASDPAVLTSLKDDTAGGDLNDDGNATTPAETDWSGLLFEPGSSGALDHADVRYASRGSYRFRDHFYTRGAVNAFDADLTVGDSRIANARRGLVAVGDLDLVVTGTAFANTSEAPIALGLLVDPTFSDNALESPGLAALGLVGGPAPSGVTLPQRSFAGVENATYALLTGLTIGQDADVVVEPGVVVKVQSGGVTVDGALRLAGTEGEPVVFTDTRDDAVGSPTDTNGDGNETAPAAGSWSGIYYRAPARASASAVTNVEVRYAATGLALSGVDLDVSDLEVSNVTRSGVTVDRDTDPTFDGLTVRNAPDSADPVLLSVRAAPTFSDVSFVSTGSRGIGLLEGAGGTFIPQRQLLDDATLAPRSLAGIPSVAYVLRERLTVPAGRTLTVAPGTVVKLAPRRFYNDNVRVEGALVADAEGGAPVVFTDFADDSAGGDTNADGNDTAPARGGWDLRFVDSSQDGANVLRNVRVRYGNTVTLAGAYARVEGSVYEQMAGPLTVEGEAAPDVVDNEFLNVSTVPVAVSPFARPTFSGNTVANVPTLALGLLGGTFASDFTLAPQSFAGFETITYVPTGGAFDVRPGATLTVPAGTVFKFSGRGVGLTVTGALRTAGTDSDPVVFTSVGDDRYGNPADTNQDGDTAPGRSASVLLRLTDETDDENTDLAGLVLAHATVGVEVTNAAPTIRDSRFEAIESVGIDLLEVSDPSITDNTFVDFDPLAVPVRFSLASDFAASGNTIGPRTTEALGVRSETLVSDAMLERRTFAGRPGIPYLLSGALTVGTGAELTVEPGVVLKMDGNARINVKKGLVAEGGADPGDKIVFTSVRDDFYGGDTNRDSTATTPAPAQWAGITFEDEAVDADARLDHVVLRYAREAVRAESASPTITNALFQNNQTGLHATGAADPSVTGSDFDGHTQWAVLNEGSFSVDATDNWWGDDSGPTAEGNPGGTGEPVSGDVAFVPFVGDTQNPSLGDVSLNGLVQAFDAAEVLGHLVSPDLSARQLAVADVSGNAGVSAFDASLILRYVVGAIDAFPAEAEARRRPPPDADGVTVEVGPLAGAVGDTVRVAVSLGGTPVEVWAAELAVRATGATVVGVEPGPGAAGATARTSADGETGRIALAAVEPLSEPGALALVSVRVDGAGAALGVERAVVNETVLVEGGAVDAEAPPPAAFGLALAGANPFRQSTALRLDVPAPGPVRVEVLDALGRRVATLVDAEVGAGAHRLAWDAGGLAPGVYFARLVSAEAAQTVRLVVVR